MRAYIINRQIDDIRGTLYRQTMFAEFEKVIHAIEEAGGALTLDVFKGEYRKLLEAYFGDAIAIDPSLDLECLRIPHFYHAFYVYKYATGLSAAVTLSQHVLSGECGAVEKYLGFLKSGGSKFPLETLRDAGVDMTTAEPINGTIALFEKRLSELETLLYRPRSLARGNALSGSASSASRVHYERPREARVVHLRWSSGSGYSGHRYDSYRFFGKRVAYSQ